MPAARALSRSECRIVHLIYARVDAGSPKVEDLPTPEIADDEILVRVHAASIHVGDWVLMTGVPYVMRMATGLRRPKHRIPGTDVAGTVTRVMAESGQLVKRQQPLLEIDPS